MEKSADAFRTISEVAADLALPQHVLRFWETHFPQIKPLKRAGGRRYYRPADVLLLRAIRDLLHQDGYTIKGVQRLLKKQGSRGLRGEEAGSHDVEPEFPVGDAETDRPLVHPAGTSIPAGRDDLREALASIEECERILRAVRPARG